MMAAPTSERWDVREHGRAAVLAGNLESVNQICESITDPSQKADALKFIFRCAAEKSQADILEWCFKAGYQLCHPLVDDILIMNAMDSNSTSVWKVLIQHGLNVSKAHVDGLGDPFSKAVWDGDVIMVNFFLENGQDPNQAGGYDSCELGVCALEVDESEKSLELFRLLLHWGWVPKNTSHGTHGGTHVAAAELGNLEVLQLLVEHGADLEVAHVPFTYGNQDEGGVGTALHRAAYKGQAETVDYLLKQGANCNYKSMGDGRSCLWAAYQGGNEKAVKVLQDHGATD